MPVTVTHILTDGSIANQTSYTTASVSLSANKLVLLAICSSGDANPTPTVTGANRTWTQVALKADTINSTRQVTVFRSLAGSADSGALTIDFGVNNIGRVGWSIAEFDNVDTTGTNGANAIIQSANNYDANAETSFTVTLAAFADANNATWGTFFMGLTSGAITPGSGFTELGEYSPGTEAIDFETEWRNDNDTSVDWSFASDNNIHIGIALELKFVQAAVATTLLGNDSYFM